ncbi:KdsC family phosphatase [Desulfobacterium sp. N47]|uniref:3-deoxy-D-manno-octulosonate 8-phosphate phosphatase n=1 Tax=uncultured Desulfobacterium sp. TaxID=201089 RepID=E1YCZ4_9BACT|nr:3-deoxy-D-manno-octulosonate 8-phosphate phosphatase [uncultured Desulfobacterium sp.]
MIFKVPDAKTRLKHVRLLLLDVDGVMTDGTIIYDDNNIQTQTFHVRDGLGIRLLMLAGIEVGVITGRKSEALHHRCKNLHIGYIYDNVKNKVEILHEIIAKTGINADDIAYMGDDLPDISIMKEVGIPIAVANAHEIIIEISHIVTSAKGGAGAIREICEAILKAQMLWDSVIERF